MSILAKLQRIFTPAPEKIHAHALYARLVEQARTQTFYTRFGVEDSMEGRFELVNLHMHLVLSALHSHFETHPEAKELSRNLIETYFADMDRNLRELGVGDSGIFYKIRKITSNFYGRLEAYGMAQENPALWPEALSRNLFTNSAPESAEIFTSLIAYLTASKQALAQLGYAELKSGKLQFGELN